MSNLFQELCRGLRSIESFDEYRAALGSWTESLGFEFFSFGIRMPFPVVAPEIRIVSNYPQEWQEKYRASGHVRVDPTVKYAHRTLCPISWSDLMSDDSREFWDDARDYGLIHGCAQPSRGVDGTIGMLTVARSKDPLQPIEFAEKVPTLSLMSIFAHEALKNLVAGTSSGSKPQEEGLSHALTTPSRRGRTSPKIAPAEQNQLENARVLTTVPRDLGASLTKRELEILRWTAEGKASLDIADILGITERTVNFHVGNCIRKLGATGKTSAVAQAALWGML